MFCTLVREDRVFGTISIIYIYIYIWFSLIRLLVWQISALGLESSNVKFLFYKQYMLDLFSLLLFSCCWWFLWLGWHFLLCEGVRFGVIFMFLTVLITHTHTHTHTQIYIYIYIYTGKNKLTTLCYARDVQYKMPQGIHESNERPYPLWSMVLIYKGNRETKYFYLNVRTCWHFRRMWNYKYFIYTTQQLSVEYWLLYASNGL